MAIFAQSYFFCATKTANFIVLFPVFDKKVVSLPNNRVKVYKNTI